MYASVSSTWVVVGAVPLLLLLLLFLLSWDFSSATLIASDNSWPALSPSESVESELGRPAGRLLLLGCESDAEDDRFRGGVKSSSSSWVVVDTWVLLLLFRVDLGRFPLLPLFPMGILFSGVFVCWVCCFCTRGFNWRRDQWFDQWSLNVRLKTFDGGLSFLLFEANFSFINWHSPKNVRNYLVWHTSNNMQNIKTYTTLWHISVLLMPLVWIFCWWIFLRRQFLSLHKYLKYFIIVRFWCWN